MSAIARLVSGLALVGTILPPLLFFADRMALDQVKWWMLVATIVWFVATPFWMDRAEDAP
jgi:hypothetical protein